MDQSNPMTTEIKCASCKRLCPANHYHRLAVNCKTCIYETKRAFHLKHKPALKPLPAKRDLLIHFNLRQSNFKIINHLLDQVTSIGNHLQSLYCFKVGEYQQQIVQLNLIKEEAKITYSVVIYEPGSSKVQGSFMWATDKDFFIKYFSDALAEKDLRLCLKEADVSLAVYALVNTW